MVLRKCNELTRTNWEAQRGVSLVEALVAVGLLGIIAAGILPLFSQALVNNAMGREGSTAANSAREVGEYALGSNWNDPLFVVPAGATSLLVEDNWVSDRLATEQEFEDARPVWEGRWYRRSPGPSQVPTDRYLGTQVRRIVETRQHGVGQWRNGMALASDDALDGSALAAFVQLKMIDIEIRHENEQGTRSVLFGRQSETRVRVLKAF